MVSARQQWQCTVPVSGPLLMITFVLPKFQVSVNVFLASTCMEVCNFRRVIFIISTF